MSLLPSRLNVSPSPDEPRVLDIDGDAADDAFDALGSETARCVLAATYEEPLTPAEIRDEVGTSLQNVHYHIENLEHAGLLEPAGTGYSEKGNEVTVYAPASEAVVLFAGREGTGSRLREHLKGIFGLVLTLGLATLVFAVVTEWLAPAPNQTSADGGMGAMDATSETAAETAAAVDPVLAFFLGGSAVVLVVAAWWLLKPRLRSAAPSR